MEKIFTRVITEEEIKEAVALWINCSCSKSDETVTKDNVVLQYSPTEDIFGAVVTK